jgi:glycerol-3-phosphate dehydrogenase
MKRNISRLAEEPFDILVVGGGIHGSAVAREAASRGFKTALIEQGDFGQATSSNSLKIIHGGLRYLQQADFQRMRQSIKARRMFMQVAPHLVHPLPFLMPTYGHGIRGKEAMGIGLAINDWVSRDRNRSLVPGNFIPPGKIISRRECLEIFPHIEKRSLTGGAVWFDVLAANTERLTLEFVLAAFDMNAVIANYVRAKALVINTGSIQGVEAEDRISRTSFTIRCRWVVNASGPWLNTLLREKGPAIGPLSVHWTKGINLIVDRLIFPGYGVGLEEGKTQKSSKKDLTRKRRLFFFVPWQGRTMIGTNYKRYDGNPEHCRMEIEEIQNFLDELNTVYPPAGLSLGEVSFFHFGLLPVSEGQDPADLQAEPDRHFSIIDHEPLLKIKGLISVKGTKYTTAPLVAEKIINLISGQKKKPFVCEDTKNISSYDQSALLKDFTQKYRSVFGVRRLASGPEEPVSRWANPTLQAWPVTPGHQNLTGIGPEMSEEDIAKIARHLYQNYGTKSKLILEYLPKDWKLGRLVSEDPPVTAAEIVHAVREEWALKLSDVIFRRTDLGQFRCPPREALRTAAEIMAGELGWDEKKTQDEIREVREVYRPLRIK